MNLIVLGTNVFSFWERREGESLTDACRNAPRFIRANPDISFPDTFMEKEGALALNSGSSSYSSLEFRAWRPATDVGDPVSRKSPLFGTLILLPATSGSLRGLLWEESPAKTRRSTVAIMFRSIVCIAHGWH